MYTYPICMHTPGIFLLMWGVAGGLSILNNFTLAVYDWQQGDLQARAHALHMPRTPHAHCVPCTCPAHALHMPCTCHAHAMHMPCTLPQAGALLLLVRGLERNDVRPSLTLKP